MNEYLFNKENFSKWANCSVYDLSSPYDGSLNRLLDHGFIADRACVWGGIDLEGHEIAIISRTYCSDNEINNPPHGLRCIRLPNEIMGKDDLGVAIATVIVSHCEAANSYLNHCRYLPIDMLAYAIPIDMQWDHKLLVSTAENRVYAEIALVQTDNLEPTLTVDEDEVVMVKIKVIG